MMRSTDAILQDLAREEARLAELGRAHEDARRRIESLRLELAAASAMPAPSLPPHAPLDRETPRTPGEKVSLFRSLFRGRADVFPVRFVSKKTGKPGYAPACSNKWEPGVCLLRTGGRCSDCVNQAFVSVSDQVVIDHLQGRQVIGVYPLLDDETKPKQEGDHSRNQDYDERTGQIQGHMISLRCIRTYVRETASKKKGQEVREQAD